MPARGKIDMDLIKYIAIYSSPILIVGITVEILKFTFGSTDIAIILIGSIIWYHATKDNK